MGGGTSAGRGQESEEASVDRAQKRAFVAEMHEILNGTNCVVVTHYSGLDVGRISDLRRRMNEAGATFRVTKNRLTKLALEGTPYEGLRDLFTGPTGIAYSDDPVAPAKVAVEFARTVNALVVRGGAMGERQLDEDGIKALAALPSLDALRGKLIGLLQAPATKVAGVVQAPASQLARVLSAYADSAGADEAA